MNTHPHPVRRAAGVAAVAAVALAALTACGSDIDPPAQDISREKVEKTTGAVPTPARTSGNRLDFGDEYGKRPATERRAGPPDERRLNRLDFRDTGL